MPSPHTPSAHATSMSEHVAEDLPRWEDVHGDIRRFSDPAVRARMDLAECGPLPTPSHVL